jgi:hypothetical protein
VKGESDPESASRNGLMRAVGGAIAAAAVGLTVVLLLAINKGRESSTVNLDLPATGPSRVERLLAPSASSRSGVTLGGQFLDRDGIWRGTPRREALRRIARRYSLVLTRYSAALVTVKLARGALGWAPGSQRGRQPERRCGSRGTRGASPCSSLNASGRRRPATWADQHEPPVRKSEHLADRLAAATRCLLL